MYTQYPTWSTTSKSEWTASGTYISKDASFIEYFDENNNSNKETYQDHMYSIAVYFYKKKNGKREYKSVKNVKFKKPVIDKIPELDFSNTTPEDIKSEYTVTVVDLTSYIKYQPMLNLKYIVNNGEIINKIGFTYPNPTDPKMREYTFDIRPFTSMSFVFDLEVMEESKF